MSDIIDLKEYPEYPGDLIKKSSLFPTILLGFVGLFGLIGIYRGIEPAFHAVFFLIGMILFVEFSNRQPLRDRIFIKRIVGIVCIAIAGLIALQMLTTPVYAMSLDYEFHNGQIIWNWEDGESPYQIWNSQGAVSDAYPDTMLIQDVEPGKIYSLTVMDNASHSVSGTAKAPLYTFSLEIWLLFALFIGTMIVSWRIPYAAFGACLLGALLMMLIGTNVDYPGYLRIIACSTFVTSLGALYIHAGKG